MTRGELQAFIRDHCLIRGDTHPIVGIHGAPDPWLFDLRKLLLNSETLAAVADEFWRAFASRYPFQVACRELAAVPLLGAILAQGERRGTPIRGLIVRKERKTTGLQQQIEGKPTGEPIVLIDDLINSGSSLRAAIAVLEQSNAGPIRGVFSVLRYRAPAYYSSLASSADIVSLFTLDDFGVRLPERSAAQPDAALFELSWRFANPAPNHFYVLPKSGPTLDGRHVYFGSDAGVLWAVDRRSGRPAWKFKVGQTESGKEIFSTPAVWNGLVYFGAYDGNVYALDAASGARRWRYRGADWVGSSPIVAPDQGVLFIGLEHGLLGKRGSIAALSLIDGAARWHTQISSEYVHAPPTYSRHFGLVAIGANDGCLYALDAATGAIRWRAQTGEGIKGGAALNDRRSLVIVGSFDGALHLFDAHSGAIRGRFQTQNAIFSTPVIDGSAVLIASEDAHLYRIDLDTGTLQWKFAAQGRVTAAPLVVDDTVYVGAHDGRFYALEAKTGRLIGYCQGAERIANQAAYDPQTGTFYIVTAANELIALRRRAGAHTTYVN